MSLFYFQFFHAEGLKSTSMGNISSLPMSIVRLSTSLEKSEKTLKFPQGPMASRPGPMFEMQVSAAEKLTEKLLPSRLTIAAQASSVKK
jgi:hypothetical protein